ncbi:MAG TPA: SOS response-associated peptidase family protein [Reyranella sp.]|nr:SOS response-associated peptidase family protein [Reyranella sp.]
MLALMCNLYERLAPEEIPGLLEHYKLLGQEWNAVMAREAAAANTPRQIYPKHRAPVLISVDGHLTHEWMAWGMPGPSFPGKDGKPVRPSFLTNVRNTTSGHWKPWLAGAEVVVGRDKNHGGRCLVPASAFAEPDRRTSKPVQNRWFGRADGLPWFFAGIWREWTGDHGTTKVPNVGKHRLFAFLTTEPNGVVKPVHEKAMPVMLRSAEDVKRWLLGTAADALELQKPAPDDAIIVVERKKEA